MNTSEATILSKELDREKDNCEDLRNKLENMISEVSSLSADAEGFIRVTYHRYRNPNMSAIAFFHRSEVAEKAARLEALPHIHGLVIENCSTCIHEENLKVAEPCRSCDRIEKMSVLSDDHPLVNNYTQRRRDIGK